MINDNKIELVGHVVRLGRTGGHVIGLGRTGGQKCQTSMNIIKKKCGSTAINIVKNVSPLQRKMSIYIGVLLHQSKKHKLWAGITISTSLDAKCGTTASLDKLAPQQ